MKSNLLERLLAPVEPALLEQLRQEWRWAVPDNYRIFGMTIIGDWLFEDERGSVFLLETMEASLGRIADDLLELEALVESPDKRDELLLEGHALAVLKGGALSQNHCVGFRVPPVLGGPFDTSNLEVVPVSRYQVWTGRLHKAVASVPVGRRITGVQVDDDGVVSVRWQ